jgi:hypothetical protein
MLAGAVMNRPPSVRQTQWGINWDEGRSSLFHEVEDFVVTEHHMRFSIQIAQYAEPRWPLRRPSEIDSHYDKRQ